MIGRFKTLVLALSLVSGVAHAQSSADQELLDMATPKAAKKTATKAPNLDDVTAEPPKGKPAAAEPEASAAPKPVKVSAAEARRLRREAKTARKKVAEDAVGPVVSASVEPKDAQKIEPSAPEKNAAAKTAVDTIASSPALTKAAKKRAAAEPKPKKQKKKTAYDLAREKWHAEAPPEMCAQFKATAIPELTFEIQGKDLTFKLKPESRAGGWSQEQLEIAKEAFGSWKGGPTPHPRTLDLVYAATLHFGCPYVTLISGVRKDRGGSRHSHGLAADIVLPGVDDEDLAAYFRAQGFVGVGTYPRSGFVHVDTRDQSFFWIDRSKPNQKCRVQQVRKEEAAEVDELARERGSEGFINPPRLARALKVRMNKKVKAHKAKIEAKKAAAAQLPTMEQ